MNTQYRLCPALRALLILAFTFSLPGCNAELQEEARRARFTTSRKAVEKVVQPGVEVAKVVAVAGPPDAVRSLDGGVQVLYFAADPNLWGRKTDCRGFEMRVKDRVVLSYSITEMR